MSDLTHVELLCWRSASRTGFASAALLRNSFSTSGVGSCRLRRVAYSRSCVDLERLRHGHFANRYLAGCPSRSALRDRALCRRGDILLRLSGWPKVERVLQIVDAVEALGIDPTDAAHDYCIHVHNRLSVNEAPRAYTRSRHQAWLHRRRIAQ